MRIRIERKSPRLRGLPGTELDLYGPPQVDQDELLAMAQTRPLVALFDPSEKRRLTTIQTLTKAGWIVLGVDTGQPTEMVHALTMMAPWHDDRRKLRLVPQAFILEAYHPNFDEQQPFYSVFDLQFDLQAFALSPYTIPYILYSADQEALATARVEEQVAQHSHHQLNYHPFAGVVERTSEGEELLPVLAEVTQVYLCATCHRQLAPFDKARLITPQLVCPHDVESPPSNIRFLNVKSDRGRGVFSLRLLNQVSPVFTSSEDRQFEIALSPEGSDPWDKPS